METRVKQGRGEESRMQAKEGGRKEARKREGGGGERSTIQQLRMRRTHMARGNTRASETVVSGTKNGNANAIVHKPHTTEYV